MKTLAKYLSMEKHLKVTLSTNLEGKHSLYRKKISFEPALLSGEWGKWALDMAKNLLISKNLKDRIVEVKLGKRFELRSELFADKPTTEKDKKIVELYDLLKKLKINEKN